jgi:YesN/AraC family two-component response regulator
MKKRIIFVDDEPMVLDWLRDALRPMGIEWDMAFVDSGERALEIMGQLPFDVIISDTRMPRMNGAQLLAEVWKRFPKTVRLILSGHADPDLILECGPSIPEQALPRQRPKSCDRSRQRVRTIPS